jgi:acetamidase/formamidase
LPKHFHVAATNTTVHWGYFSKQLKPVASICSGDFATIETLTHHGGDDYDLLIKHDAGAESVYCWTPTQKNVARRGAGPTTGVLKRGSGEGLGVHILTGPIYVEEAEPGDVLEIRILQVRPRPCMNPAYEGRTFGVNVAASWGFHYGDWIEQPNPREVVTVFDLDATGRENWASAVHSYVWTPQADPDGFVHPVVDYPGVIVDHRTVHKRCGVLTGVRVPVRLHFGTMGLAPSEADYVSSIPPSYTGGNIDNWRIGQGTTMYYPVAVPGALFSVGDPHSAQGDSELCGTAIETSLTGLFQFVLHKRDTLTATILEGLDYPLLETADEWVIHGFSLPNYLAALGANAQDEVAKHASIDKAMRDAFRKTRRFLMTTQGFSEDEAITLMSVAIDFSVTQVVDGNWGIHAIVRKQLFANRKRSLSSVET